MKAVILAAGEGKRLRPLTLAAPKPLLKVRGKPILEHTFNNLPDAVREIILVIGYKGEQIKDYFGGEFGGRKIYYVEQLEPKGTFHALFCAKSFLGNEPFLCLVGDDFYRKEDLNRLVSESSAVLVYETFNPERFGICRINPGGFLEEIIEKPQYPCGNLANTGACVLDKSIFKESIIYGSNSEELLAPMIGSLAKKQAVKVVRGSFWFPIGYPEDLKIVEEIL
jgi:UDP-N-acetylglucosamine diphosphorylase / glucose-1-phosphate thymidylyltransferase / UDP-N-acetylgalactosamine diphosphorylase / glucosamine-1-phosphate N-acetyltransferase / galactosamine-1-phosphate N-acetyltransferase